MKAEFSILIATWPPQLSKAFHLENGKLIGRAAAQMLEGIVYKRAVNSIEGFANFLGKVNGDNWAIAAGVTTYPRARVVTKRALAEETGGVPTVARAKEQFHFPDGPGLLGLDYDPHGENTPLTALEFHAALVTCCPWLKGVGMLVTQSASSYIYERATGKQLKGPGGLHAYVLIDQALDIPSTVDAIFEATSQQYGYALITKSGAIYPRSLVDRSVAQPERLLFEASVILSDELEQRRGPPYLVPGGRLSVANVPVCPDYKTWRETDPLWLQRKRDAEPEAARVREAWIVERLATGKISRETLERAVCGGILGDDFQITFPSGSIVSIGTVRTNMRRYEGMQISDPLEPNYRDHSLCAVIFHWGIFSQAHGGYRLQFSDKWVAAREPIDFDLNLPEEDIDFD